MYKNKHTKYPVFFSRRILNETQRLTALIESHGAFYLLLCTVWLRSAPVVLRDGETGRGGLFTHVIPQERHSKQHTLEICFVINEMSVMKHLGAALSGEIPERRYVVVYYVVSSSPLSVAGKRKLLPPESYCRS